MNRAAAELSFDAPPVVDLVLPCATRCPSPAWFSLAWPAAGMVLPRAPIAGRFSRLPQGQFPSAPTDLGSVAAGQAPSPWPSHQRWSRLSTYAYLPGRLLQLASTLSFSSSSSAKVFFHSSGAKGLFSCGSSTRWLEVYRRWLEHYIYVACLWA
jgi:hypothetical protein